MKLQKTLYNTVSLFIIFLMALPMQAIAQDTAEEESSVIFTKEELTQMLAPIALYPDSLIAEILMASTYPLEIVDAERWLRQNKNLKGDALGNALQEKTWDPSIKSLCYFPDVLFAMSEKLDQTRKLGDAFLGQEKDVMATIQELRQKAEEQGNLKTTKEQQVIVEKEIIRIEPADPEVVYVPVYDPFYVYGPWWYPAYPPYYWHYPPGFVTGGFIGFGPRVYIGPGLFSWVWFDWPVFHMRVDVHRTKRFHRFDHRRDFDRSDWRHNPFHRKGVAYRDRAINQRFGSRPSRISPASPETRGYPDRTIEKSDRQRFQVPEERRERIVPQLRKEPERVRGTVERREDTKVRPERERVRIVPQKDTSFRGIGGGGFERKASERGGKSLQRETIKQQNRDAGQKDKGSRENRRFRR